MLKNAILENGNILLRPATEDDLELLMAWRSHPDVYRYFSRQKGPLNWSDHFRFWNSRKDRIDWIIHFDDGGRSRKVGTVNLTELSSDSPEIGVLIGEITLMGKGVGKRAVMLAVDWLKSRGYSRIRAHIANENILSQKLFSSLGFIQSSEVQEGVEGVYVLSLDDTV